MPTKSSHDINRAKLIASLSGYAFSSLKLNDIGSYLIRNKPNKAQHIISAIILKNLIISMNSANDISDKDDQIIAISLYFK